MKRKILIAVFSFLVSSLIIALESGGKDIESLVIQLSDGDWYVRSKAAQALGQMGEAAKDAVPVLIKRLGDADERVRSSEFWRWQKWVKQHRALFLR